MTEKLGFNPSSECNAKINNLIGEMITLLGASISPENWQKGDTTMSITLEMPSEWLNNMDMLFQNLEALGIHMTKEHLHCQAMQMFIFAGIGSCYRELKKKHPNDPSETMNNIINTISTILTEEFTNNHG